MNNMPEYHIAPEHLGVSKNELAALTCSICLHIFKDPIMLYNPSIGEECKDPCLHRFCHECLRLYLEDYTLGLPSCPLCKQPIYYETLKAPPMIFLKDQAFARELAEKPVRCVISQDCSWTGTLGLHNKELERHIVQECEFAKTSCTHCHEMITCKSNNQHAQECLQMEISCLECKTMVIRQHMEVHVTQECQRRPMSCGMCKKTLIPFMELKNHLEQECKERRVNCTFLTCTHQCKAKSMDRHRKSCPYRDTCCEFCQTPVPFCQLETHQASKCPDVLEECKCETTLFRGQMNDHQTRTCPLTKISCPYINLGCEWTDTRSELDKHFQTQFGTHMALVHMSMDIIPGNKGAGSMAKHSDSFNAFFKLQAPLMDPKFHSQIRFAKPGEKLQLINAKQLAEDEVPIGMFAEIAHLHGCSVPVMVLKAYEDNECVYARILMGQYSKSKIRLDKLLVPGFQNSLEQWKWVIQNMPLWQNWPYQGKYERDVLRDDHVDIQNLFSQ